LHEAGSPASAFAPSWLFLKTGRIGTFALVQSKNGTGEAVPRHVEISDLLARKICRGLSLPQIGKEE